MREKMRAARIAAPGVLEMVTVPIPEPGPGQVRIKLEGCGVCASNLPPWEGKPWFTYPMEPGALGHEGWGPIDAVGEGVAGLDVGDRVAFLSNHAYAEYDVANESAVVKIGVHPNSSRGEEEPPRHNNGEPEAASSSATSFSLPSRGMGWEPAMPFPGEPLGCAINIFRRSEIQAGQTVAIVGIGFLGALLIPLARQAGARVIAVAHRPYARQVACAQGAEEVVPMEDHWKVIEQVRALTDGVFCDVVVEATGKQWPLDLSAELTRERGRLIIAGYHQDGPRQVNMQLWNWRGLDVINAHERDERVYVEGIRAAAEAVASGTLDPRPLMTHTYPLEQLAAALNATRDRPEGFLKALVRM